MQSSASLPQVLYSAAQVGALDRLAIERHQIPAIDLMRRAGAAVYRAIRTKWPNCGSMIVICGGGNNAGDGYVLAELAHRDNKQVAVFSLTAPDTLSGAALLALQSMQAGGLQVEQITDIGDIGDIRDCSAELIVDALLGTGLDRKVEAEWRDAIQMINDHDAAVVSIDVPSGLNADTGKPMGIAVKAALTVTFIGVKKGLLTGPAGDYVGELYFDALNVPATIYPALNQSTVARISFDQYKCRFPPRARSAHKGNFGHVLVVGGESGYMGAALMAAVAAARTGAGLVSIATRASHAAMISAARPEVMSHGIEDIQQLDLLLERATVIVAGPGLGRSDWAQTLLAEVLAADKPTVLDADALNLLPQKPAASDKRIFTPHPGEAAGMLATDAATIQADRFLAAGELQNKYGGTVVLKGNGTIISDSQAGLSLCSDGNAGMASGGMGDLLSGIIAGLIAQQFSPDDAARIGVCLHAAAADLAAGGGERGLLATDLLPCIRMLVNPGD